LSNALEIPNDNSTEVVTQHVDRILKEMEVQLPIHLIDLRRRAIIITRGELMSSVKQELGLGWSSKTNGDDDKPIRIKELAKLGREERREMLEQILKPFLSYAIFSHRWCETGEPSYQSATAHISEWFPPRLSGYNSVNGDPGVQKLIMFCKTAYNLGYHLVWTDTTCIDKTSSAEYQESLNSMFMWYRRAHVCIVHMAQTARVDGGYHPQGVSEKASSSRSIPKNKSAPKTPNFFLGTTHSKDTKGSGDLVV